MGPEEKMEGLAKALSMDETVMISLEGFVLVRRRGLHKVERRISFHDFFRSKIHIGEMYLKEMRILLP